MPVPTQVSDLSTTIASNSPAGSDNVFPDLDNHIRALAGMLASVATNSATNGYSNPYLPNASAAVFNEAGADIDFRAEGDTDANLLFLDASTDRVGVGTSTPDAKLTVNGVGAFGDGAVGTPSISNTGDLNTGIWFPAADTVAVSTGGAEVARFDSSGNLGLGVTPSAWGTTQRALQIRKAVFWNYNDLENAYVGSNYYFDGTNRKYIINGYASEYSQGSGIHAWYTAPSGTAGNAISFTQAMTLDASGNLALGTTSAQQTAANRTVFSLAGGGSGALMNFISSAGRMGYVFGSTTDMEIAAEGASVPIRFVTNGAERARITSGGDLLVGKTASGFDTVGIELQPGGTLRGTTADSTAVQVQRKNSDGYIAEFWRASSLVGNISVTTSATAYNTSSDYRLKDNPQPLTGSGAFIDALQPKTWNWKADGSRGVGFIAHEAQAVSPSSVVGEKDAVDADGKPVMQAMEYGSAEFIANIVAELQSLRARVAALEAQP